MKLWPASLISTLVLALLAAPLAAEAQQTGKVPRIGWLSASSPAANSDNRKAFMEGLLALGWIEGKNILLEERWAEGNYERLAAQAAELVDLKLDVIVAAGPASVIHAAKRATSTIPIVMTVGIDPVGQGLISSVRHPGGNMTGLAWDPDPAIAAKFLEFLRDMVPEMRRVGGIADRGESQTAYRKATAEAALKMGLTLHEAEVGTPTEIEKAFTIIASAGAQAVHVYGSALFYLHRHQIVALAAKHKLPAIYPARGVVAAGGLMSYGVSFPDLYRRAASYVDRILKGAKPGDLPVEQPTKFELVVNLKTAKALGLAIPQSLLLRADQVVE